MRSALLVVAALLVGGAGRAGQVIHDGTVGPAGALLGPAFSIPDTAGTTRGNNLFHSFSQFNLAAGESATFTGPANIKNILTRVTGGSASMIDGIIDTTGMPTANFFFLNPFGVIFGPNAQVNVGGSFAVTTADYIKLDDGGRFDARHPANDVLTAAPVNAFGFLGPTVAPITFDGPTDPEAAFILAYLPDSKSIWIVGGDIHHQGSYLAAPGGEVVLVSVAAAGELTVNVDDPRASVDTTPFLTLGTITLNNATEYVDGTPGGQVVMEANRISFANNSGISAGGDGETTAGDILLRARSEIALTQSTVGSLVAGDGDSGNVVLTAPAIQLTDVSLGASTIGNGRAGDVLITATDFSLLGATSITVESQGAGAGGNLVLNANHVLIQGDPVRGATAQLTAVGNVGPPGSFAIKADTIKLVGGGQIISDANAGEFVGGDIQITAQSLTIDDQHGSGLTTISSRSTLDGGGGGNIIFDVGHLEVLNGAQISAVTLNSSPAGNVTVYGRDVLVAGKQSDGTGAAITSAATADGAAGKIDLQLTGLLALHDGAQITATSRGAGAAGSVSIHAKDAIVDGGSSIASAAIENGVAGSVNLQLNGSLLLRTGGLLSVSAARNDGGDITVQAGDSIQLEDSRITAQAFGNGGNVHLSAPALVYLLNSQVTAQSVNGNGGNVTIDPLFTVLNRSSIIASAILGNGGNITIISDFFLSSADSRIDASSEFGLQGTVTITSPNVDLSGDLLPLDADLLKVESRMRPHCSVRLPRGVSSFTLTGRGGWPIEPDGLLPAFPKTP